MELANLRKKLTQGIGKFKYVLLVLGLGLVLMLLPGGDKTQSEKTVQQAAQIEAEADLSRQLSEILSNVSGAGQTQVMLTINQGEKTVYQTDRDVTVTEQTNDERIQTVTVTDENRNQTGLVQQVNPPTYLGALVLCQGADDPTVRLAIVDAVSKVTGLGANQISVLKMK